jgi:myo-inositol-1(or 4)-monophosphatase
VFDPGRGELFTATRGGRARMEGPAGGLDLAGPAGEASEGQASGTPGGGEEMASAMVATGLAYDAEVRGAQAKVLARLAPRVRDIRRLGSAALDLTWTAAGRYDAYFERSVKPWDIAAGALICERAGLRVLELPALESLPWGILVARPALAEDLLELVGGA